MLWWVAAASLWNAVTPGFSRASRSKIASALPYGLQRPVRMARGALEEPEVVVASG